MKNIFLFISILFLTFGKTHAQEVDITDALKNIESGKITEAKSILQQLRSTNPKDASVIFLDAVLTKDGSEAATKYSKVFEDHPKSSYADASLFRVFSFYYSLGLYKKAENYLNRLKKDYPQSPYIAAADRKIPDIEEPQAAQVLEKIKPFVRQTQQTISEKSEETDNNFTIQAGAFLNADNAKRLNEQLIGDGYPSEISTREIGGGLLKVVTAGKFATEEEAKKVLSLIETKYNLKGRIIPITNK